MQTASRKYTFNYHSPENKPQFTVQPGEVFVAETELCTGGWLNSPDDVWTADKTCALNPTVCVAVQGAVPGQMLAVELLDVVPDKVGYTGFDATSNPLVQKIFPNSWEQNVRTVVIDDQYVYWDDAIKLPIQPMVGTLGTTPATESITNAAAGPHGGNMDVQEVCKGSTIYLPVEVEGAILHVGDSHAIQGDGEINCSGGIECRSTVTLRVQVLPRPKHFDCVRIENDAYIMTVACIGTVEETFYTAANQLLLWMVDDYGFTEKDAYLLMGQVMEARCTQYVNPTRTYICKMPKKYLVR